MRTFLKIFILLFSFTIVGKACNNSELNGRIDDTANKNNSSILISGRNSNISCNLVLNSQNPYNYVGQIHNEIISSYLTTFDDNTKDVNLIIQRINDIGNNNSNFVAIKDINYTPISSQVIISGAEDIDNQFSNVINNLTISNNAKNKLSELVNYFFIKANQPASPTLKEVDDYFIKFENSIIDDNTFTENDRRTLLSAVSTARYSSCFWYNYFDVENSSSLNVTSKRTWWQWLIVGAADVVGAAVGSIPATATVGVAGAAIVGAASVASTAAYTMTNPNTK